MNVAELVAVTKSDAGCKEKGVAAASPPPSTAMGRHIRWTSPQQFTSQQVNTIVALVAKQKTVIAEDQSNPLFMWARRHVTNAFSMAHKFVTSAFEGVLKRFSIDSFFKENACIFATEEEQLLARVACIQFLPPWCYNAHPVTKLALNAKILKDRSPIPSPWYMPPYDKADDVFAEARKNLFSDAHASHHQLTITTPDAVELNGIWIKGESKEAIIFVPGIGGVYEEMAVKGNIAEFIAFFQRIYKGVNIAMINFRGIGISQGTTTPDSVQIDIFSLFQFLVAQGFEPENILVWCHSLGNVSGIKGAALVQKEFPKKPISIASDRSFVCISDVVSAHFPALRESVKKFIQEKGLDVDCEEAAATLQGQVVCIQSEEDPTIPYEQSAFHVKIDKTKIKNYTHIKLEKGLPLAHTRPFTEKEAAQISQAVAAIFTQKK